MVRKLLFLHYFPLVLTYSFCIVTAVAFRPDGQEIAVSALDGEIKFWQPNILMEVGSIEGRKDLGTGRKKTDLVTAKHLSGGR